MTPQRRIKPPDNGARGSTKSGDLSPPDVLQAFNMEKVCLTPKAAAEALSLGLRTLARLRERGEGPRYIRIGKAVRYPVEELREWRGRPSDDQH
jgi:hypothetical protein